MAIKTFTRNVKNRENNFNYFQTRDLFLSKLKLKTISKMSLTDESVDNSDFIEVSETNFQRVHNGISKAGYADGANDGRESVFQDGFDYGYADGLKTGFEIAKYKYFCNAIKTAKCHQNENLLEEAKTYLNLKCEEYNSPQHYQLLKNTQLPLKNVSKLQNDYVEKYLEHMTQKLPQTTILLTK